MRTSVEQVLAGLFREAGRAHHQAFLAVDGHDPEWPTWYAAHLEAPLRRVLGPGAVVTLAADLAAVDAEHRSHVVEDDWPTYYARWFLRRYGAAEPGQAYPGGD